MVIYACPRCGSRSIRQGALHVGALTGTKDVCRQCNYQGIPLLFETEEEYQQFYDEIQSGSLSSSHPVSLSKKERALLTDARKHLSMDDEGSHGKKPYGLIILVGIVFLYSLLLFPSLILSFIYVYSDSIQMILEWYQLIFLAVSLISLFIIPYGFLYQRKWVYTLSGILFIMSLPTGLLFLYYLTRPHVKAYFNVE